METEFVAEGVRGILHTPDNPTGDALALTHGAGSNCQASLLVKLARLFAAEGLVVLRYDLPFRQARPSGPPHPSTAERDQEGVAHAVKLLHGMVDGRVFAGGHSYGGRMTAMAASERPEMAAALLLLSYPLHPPKKPEQLRTGFFPDLRTPALFVHGTADPFGTIEELQAATPAISAPVELLPVERSGHDLLRAAPRAQEILKKLLTLAPATS